MKRSIPPTVIMTVGVISAATGMPAAVGAGVSPPFSPGRGVADGLDTPPMAFVGVGLLPGSDVGSGVGVVPPTPEVGVGVLIGVTVGVELGVGVDVVVTPMVTEAGAGWLASTLPASPVPATFVSVVNRTSVGAPPVDAVARNVIVASVPVPVFGGEG